MNGFHKQFIKLSFISIVYCVSLLLLLFPFSLHIIRHQCDAFTPNHIEKWHESCINFFFNTSTCLWPNCECVFVRSFIFPSRLARFWFCLVNVVLLLQSFCNSKTFQNCRLGAKLIWSSKKKRVTLFPGLYFVYNIYLHAFAGRQSISSYANHPRQCWPNMDRDIWNIEMKWVQNYHPATK